MNVKRVFTVEHGMEIRTCCCKNNSMCSDRGDSDPQEDVAKLQ